MSGQLHSNFNTTLRADAGDSICVVTSFVVLSASYFRQNKIEKIEDIIIHYASRFYHFETCVALM